MMFFMVCYDALWYFMILYDFHRILYGILCFCMVFNDLFLIFIVFYMVVYDALWYFDSLLMFIIFYMVFYDSLLIVYGIL